MMYQFLMQGLAFSNWSHGGLSDNSVIPLYVCSVKKSLIACWKSKMVRFHCTQSVLTCVINRHPSIYTIISGIFKAVQPALSQVVPRSRRYYGASLRWWPVCTWWWNRAGCAYSQASDGQRWSCQITSNWSTLLTTSCMSDGDMVVFEVEPNNEDVLFIHMWSNLPIEC
jgi:hypothetical protein